MTWDYTGAEAASETAAIHLGLRRNQVRILSAYVELIEEIGTDDVSFRLIARRAGVGERTVFRHYGTRTQLLLAVVCWIEHVVFLRPDPDSIFDVPLFIRQAMEAYHRRPELAHVVAETTMRGADGADPAPSGSRFDAVLRREIPSLGAQQRRDVVVALAHLDSAGTWVALRRQFGMMAHDISDAAAWAAEAVLDPLRAEGAA